MRATALHAAARRGFVEVAEALLECGARIDARDKNGVTALERAANCRQEAVKRMLMARGAKVSPPLRRGRS
jgi:ankyrin repeat protein